MNHRGHLKLGEKAVCMVFWGEFLGGVGEKKNTDRHNFESTDGIC